MSDKCIYGLPGILPPKSKDVLLTTLFSSSCQGMEEPPVPPPRTPVARRFKVGDLVQVFHGTGAYVEGRNTVSYIGRIVGYNNGLGKWEVHCPS